MGKQTPSERLDSMRNMIIYKWLLGIHPIDIQGKSNKPKWLIAGQVWSTKGRICWLQKDTEVFIVSIGERPIFAG